MTTREIHTHYKPVVHVPAQAITTTNTPSTGVDLKGYEAAEFLINIGTVTNIANSPQPTWSLKLQHSDTSNANFEDVTDSTMVATGSAASPVSAPDSSTGVFLTIDAASEDAAVYSVGYVGPKRYARVVNTAANTPGSTPYAVTALLHRPSLTPTSH